MGAGMIRAASARRALPAHRLDSVAKPCRIVSVRRSWPRPLLLLACLLVAAATAAPAASGEGDFPNLRRVTVGSAACREIVIIGNVLGPGGRDRLALVDPAGNLLPLDLPDELDTIDQVLVSPGKEKLLVVSVGEGHQWVNVYSIPGLLDSAAGGEVNRLAWVDPYPFHWEDVKWTGLDRVQFRSPGDYARLAPESHRPASCPDEGETPRGWIWNTGKDVFSKQ